MGWKGALKSVQASIRQAEKEAERKRKHQAKLQMLNDAEITVEEHNEYIERITSIHAHCISGEIDWKKIANQSAPSEPKQLNQHEAKAQYEYDTYKPSLFDKI